MTKAPNLNNPFWKFSLVVYGAPGVADECLALQERLQLDVNLLLFAAYAGAVEGVRLQTADIAAAADTVATWHGEIVRALRRARRALQPFTAANENALHASSAALRMKVKAAELEAEKIEQAMFWEWSRKNFTKQHRDEKRMALAANLSALLAHYRTPADQAEPAQVTPRLIDAVLNHVSSEGQREGN